MLSDRSALVSRALALAAALALAGSAAAQQSDSAAVAHELDRTAGKLLESASGSPHPFTPASSRFVESLDEFAATAHDYATGPDLGRRDAPVIRKLGTLADQVQNAMLQANVSPDIAQLWQETRGLLNTLKRGGTGESKTRRIYREAGEEKTQPVRKVRVDAGAELRAAAAELHRTADELVRAVQGVRAATPTERETLAFKARHLAENAQSVEDLAETSDASDPRMSRALEKVDFYHERVEGAVAELSDPSYLRVAHEAFIHALDQVHAVYGAARAHGKAHGKPPKKRKKKPQQ